MQKNTEKFAAPQKQKTVLVTGGSSGIGEALLKLYIERGYNLAYCSRSCENLKELQDLAEGKNQVFFKSVDVCEEQQVRCFVEEVLEKYSAIDVVVCSAGIVNLGLIANQNIVDLWRVFEVNVKGVLNTFSACCKYLKPGAVFVAISSESSIPISGLGTYPASKAAVNVLTAMMARELQDRGIYIFSYNPGHVDTKMQEKAFLEAPDGSEIKKLSKIWRKEGLISPVRAAASLITLIDHPFNFKFQQEGLISYKHVLETMLAKPKKSIQFVGKYFNF